MPEMQFVVQYEKHSDGTYYIRSEQIPGFRLVGPDLDALQRDLNPLVSDLLLHNMGIEVDAESIHWVPSPDEVKRKLQRPPLEGRVTYVAHIKTAA